MNGVREFDINETRYHWCVRGFSFLRRRLGINIKVHDADGHIEAGQIFLFNHFTRFETIIPQYFIYQATGVFCRCVAASELFIGNEGLAKFLWSVGAVPHDHPGLLPFLAAEILRGRKIIFFPEGGMIKDRRVIDDDGQFNIFSPIARTTRKHHQGAAATALTLEIFKKRILSVYEAGDTPRLHRWVGALGLDGVEALVAAARRPTLIVPANITFYPIHTSDNILRKGAELFSKDISGRAKEELLIESNLLLKRTDMDIRFGELLRPNIAWNLWERFILKRAFDQTDSLEQLFALKDKPGRWVERMVATAMKRETRRLRDAGMREMYTGVTVNLNHLASRLILTLFDQGTIEIDRGRFHKLLYVALKKAQQEPAIHLHAGLTNPETYDGLYQGNCRALETLLETATVSGLVEAKADRYQHLPKLRHEPAVHVTRLENVVRVYANEIAPVSAACRAVDQAILTESTTDRASLARLLFDDEIRAYAWCKANYSGPTHAAINDLETATASGEPYLLVPDQAKAIGIVLVHGLLASPAELKALGNRLAVLGHKVVGVRLKGHGTSPWDLRDRRWQDWLDSVRRGFEIMRHLADHVCLIGFSTGGVLALHLAAEKPQGLVGVAAVAPPLKFRNRNLVFVPIIHSINKLTEWASSLEGIMPFRTIESEHPDINYRHVPIRSLFELRRATDDLKRRLPDVTCPVRIIQGAEDRIVDPESAQLILDKIGSAEKSLHMVPSQRHGILNEDIGDTQGLVISFLDSLASVAVESAPQERSDARTPLGAVVRAVGLDRIRDAISPRGREDSASMVNAAGSFSRSMQVLLASFRRARPHATSRAEQSHRWESAYPNGIDWRTNIEPKPLTALLDDAVGTYMDKICVSFRGKRYSYGEIGALIDRAAKGLRALGVDKGIRVGLMLPNCPYAVICFYAVLKAGGTVVNINPLYAEREIEKLIADSSLRILVTMDVKGFYDKIAAQLLDREHIERIIVCRMSGVLRLTEKILFDLFKGRETAAIPADDRHVLFERLVDNDGAIDSPEIDPRTDVAVLQYTGGTTGFLKAAQLTHANLFVNAAQIALWAPDTQPGREKFLAVLPLFHAFGMTAVMNLSFLIGAEMILLAKFQPTEVLETIEQEKPTIFIGVPTMYSALNAAHEIAKYDMSSLKFCISGGAPLPREVQRRFEELSLCTLVEGYGLSEASPVCTVNPLKRGGKPGSVGLPLPGTVIEIVSVEDPGRSLAPGEPGEVCVTGPQVMLGYANRAKENLDVFRGGRLHTGDVGYMDEEGYLYIVDRIKDLILSGGFNVYPRMVEDAVMLHPAVEEVAVCGAPDQHRGEIVKAFVMLRKGQAVTALELRAFLKDKLAPYQMPGQIEFRDTLPKTLIGKISKKDLLTEETAVEPEPETAQTAET